MDWQTPISLVIVFASACILLLKLFRSAAGQGGCSDCSSCAANKGETSGVAPKVVRLVQLQDDPHSVG